MLSRASLSQEGPARPAQDLPLPPPAPLPQGCPVPCGRRGLWGLSHSSLGLGVLSDQLRQMRWDPVSPFRRVVPTVSGLGDKQSWDVRGPLSPSGPPAPGCAGRTGEQPGAFSGLFLGPKNFREKGRRDSSRSKCHTEAHVCVLAVGGGGGDRFPSPVPRLVLLKPRPPLSALETQALAGSRWPVGRVWAWH